MTPAEVLTKYEEEKLDRVCSDLKQYQYAYGQGAARLMIDARYVIVWLRAKLKQAQELG